eukprot:TRINITY_DN11795_c0_g1_i1.p1 TRINITY_DN11795_c0_g1~~TRINITY_DN11795_c0_g1_i1.p1  ORF type:complete len:230 (+),score=27.34 TRINITY_DN11795_c0_g1_i1:65-754(+)
MSNDTFTNTTTHNDTDREHIYSVEQDMRRIMYPIMGLVYTGLLLLWIFAHNPLSKAKGLILLILGLMQMIVASFFMFNIPGHYIGILLIVLGAYHALVGKDVFSWRRDRRRDGLHHVHNASLWLGAILAVFGFLTVAGLNVITFTQIPWFETVLQPPLDCYLWFGFDDDSYQHRCHGYISYLQFAAYLLVWHQVLIFLVIVTTITREVVVEVQTEMVAHRKVTDDDRKK